MDKKEKLESISNEDAKKIAEIVEQKVKQYLANMYNEFGTDTSVH